MIDLAKGGLVKRGMETSYSHRWGRDKMLAKVEVTACCVKERGLEGEGG